MGIVLPGPVDDFLSFIGVSWPNVDEDAVRAFGQHVAQFADDLHGTHQGATDTIGTLASSYQGASYDALFATWGRMSAEHMDTLLTACGVVSTGMDLAAGVIVGMKGAAIAQLIVLAIEFVEAQAAAVATFGASEAWAAFCALEGRQLVKWLEQELIGYVEAQIINAAVGPLIERVAQAVAGLVYRGTADALGVSAGSQFALDPDGTMACAQAMNSHAQAIQAHADQFVGATAGMTFE